MYISLKTSPESLYLTKVLDEIPRASIKSLCLSYLATNLNVLASYKKTDLLNNWEISFLLLSVTGFPNLGLLDPVILAH